MPRDFTRHTANSLFIPGSNFHSRNLHGFPFLHCCTMRSVCPPPKPATCPGKHTLYWPAMPLDYRCHVPRGRIGQALPPKLRTCLRALTQSPVRALADEFHVHPQSKRFLRLIERARLLLTRGFEGARGPWAWGLCWRGAVGVQRGPLIPLGPEWTAESVGYRVQGTGAESGPPRVGSSALCPRSGALPP